MKTFIDKEKLQDLHEDYIRALDHKNYIQTLIIANLAKKQVALERELEEAYGLQLTRVSTNWSCEESPIGVCFYDRAMDQFMDSCIICGDPDERK